MARAPVRFHPAAAQEAEAAYDWYAARDLNVADAFRDEFQHAIEAVARSLSRGRATDGALDATSSRAIPSASSTDCVMITPRSLPSLMPSDDPGTGDPACSEPSNFTFHQPARSRCSPAAGERERSAA